MEYPSSKRFSSPKKQRREENFGAECFLLSKKESLKDLDDILDLSREEEPSLTTLRIALEKTPKKALSYEELLREKLVELN